MPSAQKGKHSAPAHAQGPSFSLVATSQANPGDNVRIVCGQDQYTGVLLPRSGAPEFITLKLASGYNIGIRKNRIQNIEILKPASSSFSPLPKPLAHAKIPTSTPFISLLGCGGTIVNKIDYRTGAVHPATTPEELVAGIPSASKFNVLPKTLFSIPSEDMTPAHWEKIAQDAAAQIKDGAEGIVITHGTDTMHYTSAALSFMLQRVPCPIILTGSQRSSDRGSSDAESNVHASLIAAKADLSGVYICMHENLSDDCCAILFGTKVRKMHTTRRDAFRSINVLPAGRVHLKQERFDKISPSCKARNPTAKPQLQNKLNTNVALQYIYPGMKPQMISALSKYDGVVLSGLALAHLPINLGNDPLAIPILEEVKELISSGVCVFLASQCIYGRVDMDVYTYGRAIKDAGIFGNGCDMTPETAYVKLMWVLGQEKDAKKAGQLMETSIVGEISDRSEIVNY